ncbi:MAG: hypothetical protein AAGA32_13275 [Pseudomonadota bacterium]
MLDMYGTFGRDAAELRARASEMRSEVLRAGVLATGRALMDMPRRLAAATLGRSHG